MNKKCMKIGEIRFKKGKCLHNAENKENKEMLQNKLNKQKQSKMQRIWPIFGWSLRVMNSVWPIFKVWI